MCMFARAVIEIDAKPGLTMSTLKSPFTITLLVIGSLFMLAYLGYIGYLFAIGAREMS